MSHTGTVKRVFLNKRAQSRLIADNDSVMSDAGESDKQKIIVSNKENNKFLNFIVLTAHTAAPLFFENPALDRGSNPHAIVIRI
jgi:hypothetical protein